MNLPHVAPGALIFDFDGTLVDTLSLHFAAYKTVLRQFGVDLSREAFDAALGGKASETIPKMVGRTVDDKDVATIHARKKDMIGRMFLDSDVSLLGPSALVEFFRGRMTMALVSSGSRPGIEVLLRRMKWDNVFQVVVTGEDVENGKPHPDPYLLAGRLLGVAPENCLVFEDSLPGVESARAAGMNVIDVTRPLNLPVSELPQ
jgi:beta-phosphoglucomutase